MSAMPLAHANKQRHRDQLSTTAQDNNVVNTVNHHDDTMKSSSHAVDISSAFNLYTERMSESEPLYLQQLRESTEQCFVHNAARMISGASQGALLSLLASTHRAKNILELGTFTGYSALSLVTPFSAFTGSDKCLEGRNDVLERVVHTCDIDERTLKLAKEAIDKSPFGNNVSGIL